MTVGELLRSQQRWGLTRSRKFLAEVELNESRTIGRLTERQRKLVARELELRSRTRRATRTADRAALQAA